MKAIDVFRSVSYVLQDLDHHARRWKWEAVPDQEEPFLPHFLNSAQRMVAINRPDATARMDLISLESGPRQTIPENCLSLLDLVRNMGTDQDNPEPGIPIIKVERSALDTYDAGWYQGADATEIYNYAYDKLTNPLVYWVSPSPAPGVVVEAVLPIDPPAIEGPDDDLSMPGIYHAPLVHWMLWEIMGGDNSDVNFNKALQHYKAFHQVLGVKLQTDLRFPIELQKEK